MGKTADFVCARLLDQRAMAAIPTAPASQYIPYVRVDQCAAPTALRG